MSGHADNGHAARHRWTVRNADFARRWRELFALRRRLCSWRPSAIAPPAVGLGPPTFIQRTSRLCRAGTTRLSPVQSLYSGNEPQGQARPSRQTRNRILFNCEGADSGAVRRRLRRSTRAHAAETSEGAVVSVITTSHPSPSEIRSSASSRCIRITGSLVSQSIATQGCWVRGISLIST